MINNYAIMSDEQLLQSAAQDKYAIEVLVERYKDFVRAKARPYFLIGGDREDIIQEGMIGLYKAIRDYDSEKKASFKTFADMCTTRQIITAVKAATRQKHQPLNTYISLDKPMFDQETDRKLGETMSTKAHLDPEEILIRDETIELLKKGMLEVLSSLELSVLKLYLEGKSYKEISSKLKKDIKSIDNALQRVKKKMEKYINKSH